MHHLVSGFINVTDLSVHVAWDGRYLGMHHLACQSTPCLHLILLLFVL